jgi:hypothetical protein
MLNLALEHPDFSFLELDPHLGLACSAGPDEFASACGVCLWTASAGRAACVGRDALVFGARARTAALSRICSLSSSSSSASSSSPVQPRKDVEQAFVLVFLTALEPSARDVIRERSRPAGRFFTACWSGL